jgi:hypothetical protein
MSTIEQTIGDGTSVLPTDPNPNTTAPPMARVWSSPVAYGPSNGAIPYFVALDGTSVTFQLWMFDATMNYWFKCQSSVGLSQDTVATLNEVPRGQTYFLQITVNLGVKQIGFGFMGDG